MTRRRALALGALGVVVGGSVWIGARRLDRLPVAPAIVVETAYVERADTLRRGEALATLLLRRGLDPAAVARFAAGAPGLNPRRLPAGQVFAFLYPLGETRPARVSTRLDDAHLLVVARRADGDWRGRVDAIAWTIAELRVAGAVERSLYESIHALVHDSVLPGPEVDRFIADLADGVYGWTVDFSRDLFPGDSFQVIYERLTSAQADVRYGRLVAARVDTRGIANRAYLMDDGTGRNAYYDGRGESLRRAFKKYPVAFLRISSNYSTRRLHPVLGTWRAHRGTDYSARRGTEIYATGDGAVRFAGRNGGYGLMVAIGHPGGVETRYAHMSRIRTGLRAGVRVVQGQVIGYVGASGLANGPHVHYEFLKNGRYQDPRAVDVGGGAPLPPPLREVFAAAREHYDRLLDHPASLQVAAGDDRDGPVDTQ